MPEATESLKNVVLNNFEYFRNWYHFNFNIEKFLSEKALEKVFSTYEKGAFAILIGSNCTRTAVRKNMLALLGLKTSVDYDIDSRPVKLAITDKHLLKRAMTISGAIFYHR
ncbi:MAG: hypothetical protein LBB18_01140, partial [Puniceicoccales bacterium]|nr:hypothetical protein [Puniceicoccales bacterium]